MAAGEQFEGEPGSRGPSTPLRRRILADGLGMPAFPPQMVPGGQELGTHIMGAVVVTWVADLALGCWGERWLEGGSMSYRFRRHLEEGLVLELRTRREGEELFVEILGEDGELCCDSRLGLVEPAGADLDEPEPAPLVGAPLEVESLSAGARYGSISVDFDAARDQAFLERLAVADPFFERGLAHPAWLLSAANALMRRALALPLPNSAQAGVTITSLAPIVSGATLVIDGRLLERFDRGERHFLVSRIGVRSAGELVALLDLTSCWW